MGTPNNPDAFANLFEEMANLLQHTLDNIDRPLKEEIPKDLEKKLVQLERDVNAFCAINAAIAEEAQTNQVEKNNLGHLSKRERKVLDRSQRLVERAEEKQKELTQREGENSNEEPPVKESGGRKKFLKRINRKKI